MSDAKAALILDAQDRTKAAFAAANTNVKGLQNIVKTASFAFTGLFSVLGARRLVDFARDAIQAGDAISNISKSAGVSAESLQRLRFAFSQLSHATDDEVDDSLVRFNRLLGDAIEGQGAAIGTLRNLGIQWRTTGGEIRGTEPILEDTLRQLAAIENPAIRAARAADLFGREAGPKLATALGKGIDAMEAMREAAPGVLSNNNIQLAAELNDEFDKMARTVGGTLKNAFIEATARAGEFFGIVDLSKEAEILIQIRDLEREIERFNPGGGQFGNFNRPLAEMQAELNEARRQLQIERQIAAGAGGFATRSFLNGPSPGEVFAREYQLFLRNIQTSGPIEIDGIVNPLLEVGMVADETATRMQRLFGVIMTPPAGNLDFLRNAQESLRNVSMTPELDAEYGAFLDRVIQHNAELAEVARLSEEELTQIAISGMADRAQFEAMSAKQRTINTLGSLAAMTAGTAMSNEKIFKIHKAASLAHAMVTLPAAIIESFRNAGGWPWGAVAAAGMAAAGAAQIAAIKSASFSGGTTPALAGSAGSIGGQPVSVNPALPLLDQRAESRRQVMINVTVQGSINGPSGLGEFADLLSEEIADRIENGDHIIISGTSRQASVIRGD